MGKGLMCEVDAKHSMEHNILKQSVLKYREPIGKVKFPFSVGENNWIRQFHMDWVLTRHSTHTTYRIYKILSCKWHYPT